MTAPAAVRVAIDDLITSTESHQMTTAAKSKRHRAEPEPTDDPIIGVPLDEFIAWIESWDTPDELPEPKPRRLG